MGLRAFVEHLKKERDQERILLVKELNRLEKSSFARDFSRLLGEDAPVATAKKESKARG